MGIPLLLLFRGLLVELRHHQTQLLGKMAKKPKPGGA